MTQEERLAVLTEAFIRESDGYRHLEVPRDPEEQRGMLRSLMNIRRPRPLPAEVQTVQDAYLKERAEEKGIVSLKEIPVIARSLYSHRAFADTISLWQGDITRLKADAIVNAANEEMLGCFVPLHACIDNQIQTFAGVQMRLESAALSKGRQRLLYRGDDPADAGIPKDTRRGLHPAHGCAHDHPRIQFACEACDPHRGTHCAASPHPGAGEGTG